MQGCIFRKNVVQRFLRYVSYETTSDPASEDTPSTPGQLKLAALLKKELSDLGWEARCGADGYVYASLPASKGCEKAPAIGFVSHMDTSDAVSGKNVKAKIVENYDGKDVLLEGSGDILSPEAYPELKKYVGKTLIVTAPTLHTPWTAAEKEDWSTKTSTPLPPF